MGVCALNLYGISPLIGRLLGPGAGNFAYILVRVAVIAGVAYIMTRRFGRKRFQAIAAASFVAFVDHAVLKAFLAPGEFLAAPGTISFGLLMSYVASFPFIMIIAFLGTEAGRRSPTLAKSDTSPRT